MNFEEIQKIWELEGRGEPEVAIKIYILAAILYETNEKEGEAACSLILHQKFLIEDNNFPTKFRLNQQEKQNLEFLKKRPYILRSYFKDINDPKLFLRKKEVARTRAKIIIKSSLKNTPISIFLIKKNGYWKIIDGTT